MECVGIDAIEDAFQGVMGRNLGKIGDQAAQPIETQFAKGFDLLPILGAAQDSTQGNDKDIGEQMPFESIDAWVLEFAKVVFDGKRGSHGNSSMKGDVISVPIVGVFT